MERLTYKSAITGDYGAAKEYPTAFHEILALRNALGRYEDTDLTPEEIERLKIS